MKRWKIEILFHDGTTLREEWTGELSDYINTKGHTGIVRFTATPL